RRRQEEALRQSEERFRLLVEGVKDYAIFMLDPRGHVKSWNLGADRILKFQAGEVLGKSFAAFYTEQGVADRRPEQELAMAREQGRFEGEAMRVRKGGETFWANVVLTPLYDGEGLFYGYVTQMQDLTERRRVESLEKAERQMSEFLAMLAHELRNPLAPISNALHLLALRPAADPTEQWVRDVLQRQTGQLTRLVDDLLDVSRITRSAISLNKQPLDVRAVVRAAVDGSMQWMQARRH